jgi:hypothetical protein
MKRIAAFLSIFALGLALGAAGVLLVDLRTRAVYRDVLRTNLVLEQEMLAARTARQGDRLRSLVHRWNAVDASSQDGFRIFRPSSERDDDFFDSFRLLGLKHLVLPSGDEARRAASRNEGLERGRLALALEAIGSPVLADEQWRRAKDLLGCSLEQARRLTLSMLEVENSDVAKQGEAVVLDGKAPPARE